MPRSTGPRIRQVMAAALLAMSLTMPARAETIEQSVIRQLEDQGYDAVQVSRTLLGRLFVVATAGDIRREIVINPATGEILRDILREPSRFAVVPRNGAGQREDRSAAASVDLPERMVTGDVMGAAGGLTGGDLGE